jgi:hypothetical protein
MLEQLAAAQKIDIMSAHSKNHDLQEETGDQPQTQKNGIRNTDTTSGYYLVKERLKLSRQARFGTHRLPLMQTTIGNGRLAAHAV